MRPALSNRLPEKVFDRIHQDVGSASMCWERPEGAGTFDAMHASNIAFELCHYVADLLDEKSK